MNNEDSGKMTAEEFYQVWCRSDDFWKTPVGGSTWMRFAEAYHQYRISQDAPVGPKQEVLCAARHSDTGANDPQDCDWPFCGCDPKADAVIEAIQESGFTLVKVKPCY